VAARQEQSPAGCRVTLFYGHYTKLYRDELRAAIESSGVRVVADRGNLRLTFGTFPVFDLAAEDNAQALRLIDALARFYASGDREPDLAELAHRIVGRRTEPVAIMQVLQEWIQANVAFVPERRERFQNPWLTVKSGGDCDDHAILVGTLAGFWGLPARAEPVYDRDNAIVHTAERVYVGGGWRWVETTLAARWDEPPRDAAIRLGVARPDIVG
jgi:transglutaminase-like putative cysteine protease